MSENIKARSTGPPINQQTTALATQNQEVAQINFNQQMAAVAIAVGEESVARAHQNSIQSNQNLQNTEVTAQNTDTTPCDACSEDSNSNVNQIQDVDQINVNMQENAVAISIDGGDAEAVQSSFQNNNNAQNALASAQNENECQSPQTLASDATEGQIKKEMENKNSRSSNLKAHAAPEKDTKIIVDVIKGTQKFTVKVTSNGEVLLNDHKVDVLVQKGVSNKSPSVGSERRNDYE